MRIPEIARYEYVYQRVYDFFFDFGITDFPISPQKLIQSKEDWVLSTYDECLAELGGDISREALARKLGSRDAVTYLRSGKHLIVYDDWQNFDRVNFTLMHEIAHIYLNHFRDFEQLKISRVVSSTGCNYNTLETEANIFARNVLSPITLIDHCRIPPNQIHEIFAISSAAQEVRVKLADEDRKHFNEQQKVMMLTVFHQFIHKKRCLNCNVNFVSKGKYCIICGSDNVHFGYRKLSRRGKRGKHTEEVSSAMIYSGIELDEENKALKCPNCANEEIDPDGDFCLICGQNLTNFCEGYINEYGNLEEEGCGKRLPGNARFCPHCGCAGHFYNKDFLKPWNSPKNPSVEPSF